MNERFEVFEGVDNHYIAKAAATVGTLVFTAGGVFVTTEGFAFADGGHNANHVIDQEANSHSDAFNPRDRWSVDQ